MRGYGCRRRFGISQGRWGDPVGSIVFLKTVGFEGTDSRVRERDRPGEGSSRRMSGRRLLVNDRHDRTAMMPA